MELTKRQQCVVNALTDLAEQGRKKHPEASWGKAATWRKDINGGNIRMCFIGFAFEGLPKESRVEQYLPQEEMFGDNPNLSERVWEGELPPSTVDCIYAVAKEVTKLCPDIPLELVARVCQEMVTNNDSRWTQGWEQVLACIPVEVAGRIVKENE